MSHKNYLLIFFMIFMSSCFFVPPPPTVETSQPTTDTPVVTGEPTLISPPNSENFVNPKSPFGINLNEIVDYSDEDPFLDYMKTSRAWFGQTDTEFDTQESDQIDLDENEWVRSLQPLNGSAAFTRVATIMMVSGEKHNDYSGDYVVSYEGIGQLDYAGASIIESVQGRDIVHISDPAGYLQIRILSTDEENYIRNIHVVRKEYEQDFLNGAIFNPRWLEKLKPFRTIRFMDWMRTNGGTQTHFAPRSTPETARYTNEFGAPLEVMLVLSNQVHAEPWFNMPTQATDEYIQSFAEMVHRGLDPSLNVYVEYSNEVWNTGAPFHPQGSYIDQQASFEFGNVAQNDFFTARLNWHGKRTAEMCQIWKSVFSDDANRVICILGAQAANTYTAEQGLDCPLWSAQSGKRCQEMGIDAVAIAPYFGSYIGDASWQDQTQAWTVDQLFEEIFFGGLIRDPVPGDFNDPYPQGALAEAEAFVKAYREQADLYGYRLLGYEAGQHLAGIGIAQNNQEITTLFTSANQDTRMEDAYTQYLQMWREANGETLVLFNLAGRYSQFGNWGLLEYIEQPISPKYQAVSDFVTKNPCWWTNCALP